MPVVMLDQAHWAQLEQVQLAVGQQVKYVSDMERFGVPDWWEPADKTGDCEDIALTKRQRLMDLGWPAEALRIAALIDGHGQLHAVLTVDVVSEKGAPGTYVLDSHFTHVEPWQIMNQYGYYWLERSKPGSALWARLDGDSPVGTQQIASLSGMIMPASPMWGEGQAAQMVRVKAYGQVMPGREVHPLVHLQLALDTHPSLPNVDFDARVDSHPRLLAEQEPTAVENRDSVSRPAVPGGAYRVKYTPPQEAQQSWSPRS